MARCGLELPSQREAYASGCFIGGRNFTVTSDPVEKRNVIRQIGRADQLCRYDRDLYFEAGCRRIPYHHTALLALCAEFGVAPEPYIMETPCCTRSSSCRPRLR